ncbi:hypothetical protein IMCC21906_03258 (plasmid) [Spongiibacter sp. IMCC21906]|uniref:hypothetical protein n=1 Tax=Spongiibacter sp. IMCC21906 TaxID=1620392 RepID=UPI00062DF139|nr:hypothetical protein [Spongiibacter sp. IMCC21906]AKH70895.1 hypothetical protein IMCC21906_03258 [Spongiibacter sp. IMCC21906]
MPFEIDMDITDPITGTTYSIEHLKPFNVTYEIKVDGEPTEVTLRVHFASHCYTRSRKEDDPDHSVLFKEQKRRGPDDERVFCPDRWEFSKKLPDIITNLHSKGCYPGGSKELFYRHEDAPKSNPQHGWYICTRLSASDKYQNLTLSVRSAHWRTNRPVDTRGGTKRFYALLAQFYATEKQKREWL